jgi:hypothetical protein
MQQPTQPFDRTTWQSQAGIYSMESDAEEAAAETFTAVAIRCGELEAHDRRTEESDDDYRAARAEYIRAADGIGAHTDRVVHWAGHYYEQALKAHVDGASPSCSICRAEARMSATAAAVREGTLS